MPQDHCQVIVFEEDYEKIKRCELIHGRNTYAKRQKCSWHVSEKQQEAGTV